MAGDPADLHRNLGAAGLKNKDQGSANSLLALRNLASVNWSQEVPWKAGTSVLAAALAALIAAFRRRFRRLGLDRRRQRQIEVLAGFQRILVFAKLRII